MYLVGMLTAALVAALLKRTVLRGPVPPFVMELPSYKWPSWRTVVWRMLERAWGFVYRAGTLILAVAILVWAAGYYPHDKLVIEGPYAQRRAELSALLEAAPATDADARESLQQELRQIDDDVAAAYQRQSILGRSGQLIEPAVRPLGWDWRIGSAALASFPAREVFVGVLGVVYDLGHDLDMESDGDRDRLVGGLRSATWDGTDTPVYNIPVALSIMVFFALWRSVRRRWRSFGERPIAGRGRRLRSST